MGFDTVFSCQCTEDQKGAYVIFDGIACGSKRLLVRFFCVTVTGLPTRSHQCFGAKRTVVPHSPFQSHVHEPWAPGADKVGQPGSRHEVRVYLPRSAGSTLQVLLKEPVAVSEYQALLATLDRLGRLELKEYLVRDTRSSVHSGVVLAPAICCRYSPRLIELCTM